MKWSPFATALAILMALTSCSVPETPSVSRQASSVEAAPLTVGANFSSADSGTVKSLHLVVEKIDNGDWDVDFRPDSRTQGFHDVVLTQAQPRLARTFRINAERTDVSFTMVGFTPVAQGLMEVVRVNLTFTPNAGWSLELPKVGSVPFGEAANLSKDSPRMVSLITEKDQPTLIIDLT